MAKKKPGKYDHIIPKLPRYEPTDAEELSRQDSINALKDEITDRTPVKLAALYAEMRKEKDELKEQLSVVELTVEALEQLLIASQEKGEPGWGLYGANEKTIRLPSGASIRTEAGIYAKVIDKEKFRLWCIANDYENQLQLWPSVMAAVTKERLLAGEPEPDGVEATGTTSLKFSKGGE